MLKEKSIFIYALLAALLMPAGIDLVVAVLPEIGKETSSPSLMLSLFFLGASAGYAYWGGEYDKRGGRHVLMKASICLISSMSLMFVPLGFEVVLLSRAIQGFAVAGLGLAAVSIIKDNVEPDNVPGRMGQLNGFMNMAPAIMPSLSVGLLAISGEWKSSFVLFALLSAAFLLLVVLTTSPATFKHTSSPHCSWLSLLSNKPFMGWAIFPAVSLGILFMYCAFLAELMTEFYALPLTHFTLFFAINVFLMFLTGQCLSFLFTRWGARKVFLLGVCLSGVSPWLLLNPSTLSALLGLTLYCVSFIVIISSSYGIALSHISEGVGRANAIISMMQMFAGALLTGLISLYQGVDLLYCFSACIVVLAILGLARIHNTREKSNDHI
jgi:MFS family permease